MEPDPTTEAPPQPPSRREELRARLRAAGIPVPPPMEPDEHAAWRERLRQAAIENEQFWAEHRRAS